jgi:hypothetical protein
VIDADGVLIDIGPIADVAYLLNKSHYSVVFPSASGLNFRLRNDGDTAILLRDDAQLCCYIIHISAFYLMTMPSHVVSNTVHISDFT